MKLKCPICEAEIEIPEKTKEKGRITCANCFSQFLLFKQKGKFLLGCAPCPELVFDPMVCEDCERRRERKKLYEEGEL